MCLLSGNICYSPTRRSVLRETAPVVVSTGIQDRGHSFGKDVFLSRFFNPACFFYSSRPYELRTWKWLKQASLTNGLLH